MHKQNTHQEKNITIWILCSSSTFPQVSLPSGSHGLIYPCLKNEIIASRNTRVTSSIWSLRLVADLTYSVRRETWARLEFHQMPKNGGGVTYILICLMSGHISRRSSLIHTFVLEFGARLEEPAPADKYVLGMPRHSEIL